MKGEIKEPRVIQNKKTAGFLTSAAEVGGRLLKSNTGKGAIAGAIVGGTTSSDGNRLSGALTGAAVGAGVGSVSAGVGKNLTDYVAKHPPGATAVSSTLV